MLTGLVKLIAMAAALVASAAQAGPVGERHLTATNPTAALRDAQHRDTIRVTVWYPAAAGAEEASLDIGPPGKPLFRVGSDAQDAPFADARRRPVILFSHGFGGTARMMAWFGAPLARAGYIVIAVDHPGNNGLDKMTAVAARRFFAFCQAHPADGVCAPQKELPLTLEQMQAALASPELAPEVAHAGDDHADRKS